MLFVPKFLRNNLRLPSWSNKSSAAVKQELKPLYPKDTNLHGAKSAIEFARSIRAKSSSVPLSGRHLRIDYKTGETQEVQRVGPSARPQYKRVSDEFGLDEAKKFFRTLRDCESSLGKRNHEPTLSSEAEPTFFGDLFESVAAYLPKPKIKVETPKLKLQNHSKNLSFSRNSNRNVKQGLVEVLHNGIASGISNLNLPNLFKFPLSLAYDFLTVPVYASNLITNLPGLRSFGRFGKTAIQLPVVLAGYGFGLERVNHLPEVSNFKFGLPGELSAETQLAPIDFAQLKFETQRVPLSGCNSANNGLMTCSLNNGQSFVTVGVTSTSVIPGVIDLKGYKDRVCNVGVVNNIEGNQKQIAIHFSTLLRNGVAAEEALISLYPVGLTTFGHSDYLNASTGQSVAKKPQNSSSVIPLDLTNFELLQVCAFFPDGRSLTAVLNQSNRASAKPYNESVAFARKFSGMLAFVGSLNQALNEVQQTEKKANSSLYQSVVAKNFPNQADRKLLNSLGIKDESDLLDLAKNEFPQNEVLNSLFSKYFPDDNDRSSLIANWEISSFAQALQLHQALNQGVETELSPKIQFQIGEMRNLLTGKKPYSDNGTDKVGLALAKAFGFAAAETNPALQTNLTAFSSRN